MDELSILRARVIVLEQRIERLHGYICKHHKFIRALVTEPAVPRSEDLDFGNVEVGGRLYASGPAEEEEDEEMEESTPMAE